jgi:hypothetical protein
LDSKSVIACWACGCDDPAIPLFREHLELSEGVARGVFASIFIEAIDHEE